MPCEGRQHWDHAKGAHPVQDPMLGQRGAGGGERSEVSVKGPLLGEALAYLFSEGSFLWTS